ncbi:LTA synthase family protein [Clostridium sp. LBM24168]
MNKFNFIDFIDIIIFLVLVPYKILNFGKQINTANFSNMPLLLPSSASVIVLLSISLLFCRKNRSRFLYICNLVISLLIISDLNYFRYFKDIISIPVLINGLQLGAVGSSVKNIMRPGDFLYTVDLFIIPFMNNYINKHKNNSLPPFKLRLSFFLCLLVLAISTDYIFFYKLSKEQPRLLSTMYNKVYITKHLGMVNYHYLDIYNTIYSKIDKVKPIPEKKLTEIQNFMDKNESSKKNLHAAYEGKNLIVIQVEALQQFVINSSIAGKEITPNLNKMAGRSEYFDNFHYQVAAGGTSDAEFMANNSLYPAESGAAYFLYSGNKFQSMPESFINKGYDTSAFHGFRESFWNRNVMYKNFKFNHFYGEKSFKKNETIGLGLSDKSFLNQSVDKLKDLKSPYYAFLITLSSHFPYDDVKNYGNFSVGKLEGTFIGNYIKSIHYTDAQLGMFFDRLRRKGILKNSVIVLYGDHYAIPRNKQEQFLKFYNKSSISNVDWINLQKVPFMIHFPDERVKGINHINSGEMDIYPTISNLFNLSGNYMMGNDLFNEKKGVTIYRDGSFIYGKCYYMSENNTYYDIATGLKLPETEELMQEKQSVLNQLEYSDDILKHNLLETWLNK